MLSRGKWILGVCLLVLFFGVNVSAQGIVFELNFEDTLVSTNGCAPLTGEDFELAVTNTKFRGATGDESFKWKPLEPVFVEGVKGKGLQIDDGIISLTYKITDHVKPQEGTMEFWYKPAWSREVSPTGLHKTLAWWGAEQWFNDFTLYVWKQYTTGAMAHYDERRAAAEKGFPWEQNVWYHVVCTWRRGSIAFYVNGELAGEKMGIPPTGEEFYLNIGHRRGVDIGYGVIDEFKMYDISKSSDDIKALYISATK